MAKNERLLQGKVLIDNKPVDNVNVLEITPGGNGHYAITLRATVSGPLNIDPAQWLKPVELRYENVFLPQAIPFTATLLDTGIEDRDGKVIFSMFFKAERKPSAVIQLPPKKIELVK